MIGCTTSMATSTLIQRVMANSTMMRSTLASHCAATATTTQPILRRHDPRATAATARPISTIATAPLIPEQLTATSSVWVSPPLGRWNRLVPGTRSARPVTEVMASIAPTVTEAYRSRLGVRRWS